MRSLGQRTRPACIVSRGCRALGRPRPPRKAGTVARFQNASGPFWLKRGQHHSKHTYIPLGGYMCAWVPAGAGTSRLLSNPATKHTETGQARERDSARRDGCEGWVASPINSRTGNFDSGAGAAPAAFGSHRVGPRQSESVHWRRQRVDPISSSRGPPRRIARCGISSKPIGRY